VHGGERHSIFSDDPGQVSLSTRLVSVIYICCFVHGIYTHASDRSIDRLSKAQRYFCSKKKEPLVCQKSLALIGTYACMYTEKHQGKLIMGQYLSVALHHL